jgi:hypothetical protein
MKRNYAWRECYLDAVYETDPNLRLGRIYEAIAAFEKRRLSPVETEEELRQLTKAEEGIQTLIAETGLKLV